MTKRQAHTLMALAVAIILMQVLCTAVLLRSMERSRSAVRALQVGDLNTCDQDKQVIATDTDGSAIQAEGGSVTVDVDNEPSIAAPAMLSSPPEIDPEPAECTGVAQQQAALREAQRAQDRLDAAIARALRNTTETHPEPAEPHR